MVQKSGVHQFEVGSSSHDLQGFGIHHRWLFGISSIKTMLSLIPVSQRLRSWLLPQLQYGKLSWITWICFRWCLNRFYHGKPTCFTTIGEKNAIAIIRLKINGCPCWGQANKLLAFSGKYFLLTMLYFFHWVPLGCPRKLGSMLSKWLIAYK